jgi:hypothetical protein
MEVGRHRSASFGSQVFSPIWEGRRISIYNPRDACATPSDRIFRDTNLRGVAAATAAYVVLKAVLAARLCSKAIFSGTWSWNHLLFAGSRPALLRSDVRLKRFTAQSSSQRTRGSRVGSPVIVSLAARPEFWDKRAPTNRRQRHCWGLSSRQRLSVRPQRPALYRFRKLPSDRRAWLYPAPWR